MTHHSSGRRAHLCKHDVDGGGDGRLKDCEHWLQRTVTHMRIDDHARALGQRQAPAHESRGIVDTAVLCWCASVD